MDNKQNEKNYFYFVNRSYFVASLLSERLEELNSQHGDQVLKTIFQQTINTLKTQVAVTIDAIISLGETDSLSAAQPSIDMLESIFNNILLPGHDIQYIYLYDYLSLADCMMAQTGKYAEFTGLQTTTGESYSADAYNLYALKPVLNFLKENFLAVTTTAL